MQPNEFREALIRQGFQQVPGVAVLFRLNNTHPLFSANLMAAPAIHVEIAPGNSRMELVSSEEEIVNVLNAAYDAGSQQTTA
ncbi:hypothetical protein [Arsenicibacter rosenii]|uniref:Uncharacterized protein n=1 Tax=Arsenicibacter rosenii TaxID=1750698 RepID=A0A1S2VPU5_9BACT|nr:hypothetical protein [Arsenicibacter rosenii]OIN59818.1 hypothetical protein BLX24_08140 [Arsenicibacter rosenii]